MDESRREYARNIDPAISTMIEQFINDSGMLPFDLLIKDMLISYDAMR